MKNKQKVTMGNLTGYYTLFNNNGVWEAFVEVPYKPTHWYYTYVKVDSENSLERAEEAAREDTLLSLYMCASI